MTAVFAVVSTPNSHTQVASSSANIAHVSTLNAAADISHPELGGAGRRQLLAECLVNQYVDNGACIACDTGYTRVAGDDPDGVNTACTTCAANYRVDGSNTCVACTGGRINVAGDDSTASETLCECLVNERVESGACTSCDAGYTRVAGDDPDGANTACTTCAANYRVDRSNACVPCAVGTTNVAGDDASGVASASALLPVYDAWTDGTVAANFDPAVDDANRVRHTTRT